MFPSEESSGTFNCWTQKTHSLIKQLEDKPPASQRPSPCISYTNVSILAGKSCALFDNAVWISIVCRIRPVQHSNTIIMTRLNPAEMDASLGVIHFQKCFMLRA